MQMTSLDQERQKFLRRKSSCVGAFVTCFVTLFLSLALFNLSLVVVVGGWVLDQFVLHIHQSAKGRRPKDPTVFT